MAESKKSSFDCVEFKLRAQSEILKQTEGMTPANEIEFIEGQAVDGELGAWWLSVKESSRKGSDREFEGSKR